MNHLKSFKIFESGIYNIVYDVKDICLDLDQNKFSVDIYKGNDHILSIDKDDYEKESNSKITISIEYMTEFGIPTKGIEWSEIEEVIERLIDFFKINNYEIFGISIDGHYLSTKDISRLGKFSGTNQPWTYNTSGYNSRFGVFIITFSPIIE